MKTNEQKERVPKIIVGNKISKYAEKPLNSSKEEAAKKFEDTAMNILKQAEASK